MVFEIHVGLIIGILTVFLHLGLTKLHQTFSSVYSWSCSTPLHLSASTSQRASFGLTTTFHLWCPLQSLRTAAVTNNPATAALVSLLDKEGTVCGFLCVSCLLQEVVKANRWQYLTGSSVRHSQWTFTSVRSSQHFLLPSQHFSTRRGSVNSSAQVCRTWGHQSSAMTTKWIIELWITAS